MFPSGIRSPRVPLLLFPSRGGGPEDLSWLGVEARPCQGGTVAYFGEANRFPAWAHEMVENLIKNWGWQG